MKKKFKILSGVLTALIGLFVLTFIITIDEKTNAVEEVAELQIENTEIPENIEFGINVDTFEVIKEEIKRNQFLANILLPFNIDYLKIDALAKKSKKIFDVRRLAVGKPYTILASKDSSRTAHYFIYQPNAIDYVIYDLRDTVTIIKGQKEVEVQQKAIGGKINSSLYMTLQEANVATELAIKMADIFAWSIDFYRVQKGDWFKVLYEEEFVDGESVGVRGILGVQFNHFGENYYAYNYEIDSTADYYDEKANSLRKAFLKSYSKEI